MKTPTTQQSVREPYYRTSIARSKLHTTLAPLLLVACLIFLSKTSWGEIVTFEDHPIGWPMANPYDGLTWSNVVTDDVAFLNYTNGFNAVIKSGSRFAYNPGGGAAAILSGRFNLNSGYFAAAWRDNLQLQVIGFRNGDLIYSNAYVLSSTAATFIHFNYLGVDSVIFSASGGVQHTGMVGDGPIFGIDDLDVTILNTVLIKTQPVDNSTEAGDSAVFSVYPFGAEPFTYQWRFNGTNISEATGQTLTVANVQLTDEGVYDVLVSSLYESTVSTEARLKVLPSAPKISVQPTNLVVAARSTATLNAGVRGSLPIFYQWVFNGMPLNDATDATLTLTNVQAKDSGSYRLLANNIFGSTNSVDAVVEVMDFPEALNATNLVWRSIGESPWSVETTRTHDGGAAAQSGPTGGGGSSVLEATVTGPGTLTFWWSVSAQWDADYLSVSVNGIERARISWSWGWVQQTVYLGAGSQNIDWAFTKNSSAAYDQDAAWLDQVDFVPGATPPSIVVQPTDELVLAGSPAILSAEILGTPPLSFQWQLDFTNIENATNALLSIASAQSSNEGEYSCVISNAYGVTNTSIAFLNVVDLSEAINATNLIWDSTNNSWFPETYYSHDGVAALQSAAITDGQQSTIETSVVGPGTLSFYWKVSSETNNDYLSFSVDGFEQGRISGFVNWRQKTCYVGPGVHLLAWAYSKNATLRSGSDAAWLDQVSYAAGATSAFVESNPANQVVALSGDATFSVSAGGTPPLSYQWLFQGSRIAEATNSVLIVSNVQITNTGAYSVLVTNNYGGTISANANLNLMSVYAWGAGSNNTMSSLGFGQSMVPTDLADVVSIAAGGVHSVALLRDGTVRAWGGNLYHQTNVPATLSNCTAIAAGLYHSLALRNDGTVSTWGLSSLGLSPIPPMVTNVASISAGWYHNLVLNSNGTVLAWGAGNSPGYSFQFGQGIAPTNLTKSKAVAAGGFHSLALQENGTVVAWGLNNCGQTNVPIGLNDVVAIAAGASNSIALKRDGTLVCWGGNNYGQSMPPASLSNVVAISAGAFHTMALTGDGSVTIWGSNDNGQTNLPAGLTNVASISAGGYHSMALINVGPVTFLAPPSSQSIFQGDSITLSPALLGAEPRVYQWLKNAAFITEGTNVTLSITNSELTDSGVYQLMVSNSFGAVTSAVAVLTVHDSAPSFALQPTNSWVTLNSNVTLRATAFGIPPLSYQWLLNGMTILGATNSDLIVVNAQLTNEGDYSLIVRNAYGTSVSSNAFLDVLDLPQALGPTNLVWLNSGPRAWFSESFTTHDGIAAAAAGPLSYNQQASLQVSITGPGKINFWWAESSYLSLNFLVDGTNQLSSSRSLSPTWTPAVCYLGSGVHTLAWTAINDYSSFNNSMAFLDQVSFTPGSTPCFITTPPVSQTNLAGNDVTFSVGAQGTPPLMYQWYFNGVALPGNTKSSLTVTNAQPANVGSYRVVVSNDYGITNAIATLTINSSPPVIRTHPIDQEMVPGGTITFAVSARGSDPLGYQWQFQDADIPEATNTSVTLRNVSTSDAGVYRVLVRNSFGIVTSSNASLLIVPTLMVGWGTIFTSSPNPPLGVTNVTAISSGDNFNAALRADGTVYPWGWDAFGKLDVPTDLTNVCAISAGGDHGSTLINDGSVFDWGDSFFDPSVIVPAGLSNVVRVAAGYRFNLALKSDGTLALWGFDPMGQLKPAVGLNNIVEISAGWYHALALTKTGTVIAWGDNGSGQSDVPVGLTNVIAIAGGLAHSMALRNDGTVVVWGDKFDGQTNVPPGLSNVVAIAAGYLHCLALKSDGQVIAWGVNSSGQTNTPSWLAHVVAISAGTSQSLALLNDGSPYITRHPWSQTTFSGMRADLTVAALGEPPLSYQWQLNGLNIPRATNSLLVLQSVSLIDSGSYRCTISNAIGMVTSLPATISVGWTGPRDIPALPLLDTNGGFNLILNSLSGHGPLLVFASTNFMDWRPLFTNPPVTGAFHFVDPENPKLPYRFYRAIEQ